MTHISHNPAQVTAPIGGYSHGLEVKAGARLLFISGQIPETPDGYVPQQFAEQCRAIWNNIFAILQSAGMDKEHLVKVITFLTDASQVQANSEIRQQLLGDCHPALTVMIAQTLQSEWLLEIEAVAASYY
ncbi:RidA family protein [Ktedonosporobacter rubrisoli]|uniref:RidA family protein n=1 Tax=Ktedonosporobacter rubrisoli TaxID=2509675 RepID=A0A4P6JZI4_KTERU|nr:RidA family protein [Ktedonosporobacter rubrisoli]QBD81154.1 RidA family protein [Ktedonosporobacter rubrisoli]